MRFVMLCMVALAGCAGTSGEVNGVYQPPQSVVDDYNHKMADLKASRPELFAQPKSAHTVSLNPAEQAKASRENELLERALTNSPDYPAAVRRAAIANIDEEASRTTPNPRRSRITTSVREDLVRQEEQRLSDAVEIRRRRKLAENQAQQRAAMDQQAIYACEARGQQMDAAHYDPRSLLNLYGMVAGVQARDACLEAYRRTGILPTQ